MFWGKRPVFSLSAPSQTKTHVALSGFARHALLTDLAIFDIDNTVGIGQSAMIMCDNHHGTPVFMRQL